MWSAVHVHVHMYSRCHGKVSIPFAFCLHFVLHGTFWGLHCVSGWGGCVGFVLRFAYCVCSVFYLSNKIQLQAIELWFTMSILFCPGVPSTAAPCSNSCRCQLICCRWLISCCSSTLFLNVWLIFFPCWYHFRYWLHKASELSFAYHICSVFHSSNKIQLQARFVMSFSVLAPLLQ